jgi:hypothetical protein
MLTVDNAESVYDIPRPTIDGVRDAITCIAVNGQQLFEAIAIHEDHGDCFECRAGITVSMHAKTAFEMDLTPGLAERLIRKALTGIMPAALHFTINIKLVED